MFPPLLKAAIICEINSLKVLVVTYDDTSPNRKLFRMHFPMTKEDNMNLDTNATYRTVNLFSYENSTKLSNTILVQVDILDTCGKMVCLYFGITFLIFLVKIENVVYTSC